MSTLEGGWCSTSRPGRFTSEKQEQYPQYRRLVGLPDFSRHVRKTSPPPPPIGVRTADRADRRESLYCVYRAINMPLLSLIAYGGADITKLIVAIHYSVTTAAQTCWLEDCDQFQQSSSLLID